jgi:hypothetical protein
MGTVGSARERRCDVESIYSEAAPVPSQIADPATSLLGRFEC